MNKQLIALLFCCWLLPVMAQTKVNVVGLFNGKAVVMINGGVPVTLSTGETKNKVKLVAANSQRATFLIEGETKTLGMGQAGVVATENKTSGSNGTVNLYANRAGHFLGNLYINRKPLKFMVDTGASTIAMNSADAKYAGIDYLKGKPGRASTANGVVDVYIIKLNQLKIDNSLTLYNVDAMVIEGGFPQVVLLGMSALNKLHMTRENSVMTLMRK